MKRTLSLLASLALTASGAAVIAAAPPANAIPSTPVTTCVVAGPRPCIESFTEDGVAPDAGVAYSSLLYEIEDATYVSFNITATGTDHPNELGSARLGDVFSVKIDMGTTVPRVVSGFSQNVVVKRNNNGGTYSITITGNPVTLSGQCDQSTENWICPEEGKTNGGSVDNNRQWDALWGLQVSDFGQWSDEDQASSIYGLDYFTNIAAGSLPPGIVHDDATDSDFLEVTVANRRFLDGGTTLVSGHVEMRIPNKFLRVAYGVPNPELMTGASLLPVISGSGDPGTITVTQETGDDAMLVNIDGMRFPDVGAPARGIADRATAQAKKKSTRIIRVKRGTIKPTRPKLTKAKRVTAGKANITFDKAKARGAKIRGYEVRCTSGGLTKVVSGKFPTVTVLGLKAGKGYDCQVRAKSKAGKGKYSSPKHLAARP